MVVIIIGMGGWMKLDSHKVFHVIHQMEHQNLASYQVQQLVQVLLVLQYPQRHISGQRRMWQQMHQDMVIEDFLVRVLPNSGSRQIHIQAIQPSLITRAIVLQMK